MSLRVVPVIRDQAVEYIAAVHRHHGRPAGYRFALGVAAAGDLVGVAMVGRPSARAYDDGLTAEVTRVATDGHRNACSMLYGACWRAARAMGYLRGLTYTQEGESGASLRAAGWWQDAVLPARAGWDTPSRQRDGNGNDGVRRYRWKVGAWGTSERAA